MPLQTGARLGPYEILSALGTGGMGEVYRARDPRLKRDIAIKVLPETTAADPERRARLEREAQSIAALSHPNIITIHSVEDIDGVLCLTMEYVDGQPLTDLIAKGGLPLMRILNLAIPLADAISAAHQKGITHRDLKPANVIVSADGRVKVLDFGLAKVMEATPAHIGVTGLPTATLTGAGRIMGTVAYMSPEQAEGKLIDHRSDLFSLGIILYELATGDRPFTGDTSASVISSIIKDTPRSVTEIKPALPRDIGRIIRRALAKDPEHRYQTAKDLRNDLEDLEHAVDSGELLAPAVAGGLRGRFWSRWPGPLTAGALLAVIGTWMLTRIDRVPDAPVITQVARLTHDAGISEWPTWSPDGSQLAFASNRGGNFDIYVRRLAGGKEVNVTNNAFENFQPSFSPDGNSIAFVSTRTSRTRMVKIGPALRGTQFRTYGGDVWVVPTLGGQAHRLAQDGNFPVWHPLGQKVMYVSGPETHRSILEVASDGGTPRALVSSDASSWEITHVRYAPHANWITFDTADNQIFIVPIAGGPARKLVSGSAHVWEPSGRRLYYCVLNSGGGTRLQSIAIDERTGEVTGQPSTVGLMTGFLRDLAFSQDGKQLAITESDGSMNLTRLPLNEAGNAPVGAEEPLTVGQVFDGQPSVSPDGRRIAITSNRLGHDQIWVVDVASKQLDVLQFPGDDLGALGPHWYPNGQRLSAMRFFPNEKVSLWWIAADASLAEELTSPPKLHNNAEGWPIAPDGQKTVYAASVNGHYQLFEFDLNTRKARQLTFSPDDKFTAAWSLPDGRWLAYTSNANGSNQLWRMPAGGGKAEALTTGDDRVRHMFYSPDGRWLYFQPNHLNIYRMPADGGHIEQVTHFPESGLFLEEPTISPDGRYLVYCRSNGGSSLWVLQLGNTQTQVQ